MTSTTIVTMFFNLKKLKDASMQTRPQEFYIENGRETLKLKYNMVIFCDLETYDFLKKIRDEEVDSNIIKTKYYVKSITDYEYYQNNWDIINNNRLKSNGYKNKDSFYFNLRLIYFYCYSILHFLLGRSTNHSFNHSCDSTSCASNISNQIPVFFISDISIF